MYVLWPKTQVGIVTPYRGQRDLIRDKLVDMFGPQELSRVRVETIDSFQGKQLDVVILSLTRANMAGGHGGSNRGPLGAPGDRRGTPPISDPAAAAAAAAAADGRQMLPLNRAGVGFLSDVRRMNVAITRARLACLILGRVETLQQDAAWSALVADATARGCLFQVRNKTELPCVLNWLHAVPLPVNPVVPLSFWLAGCPLEALCMMQLGAW
jgi:senataxin